MIKKSNPVTKVRSLLGISYLFDNKLIPKIKSKVSKIQLFISKKFTSYISLNHHELSGQKTPFGALHDNEILFKPAPIWSRSLTWSICGSIGFGFIFACIARIDEVVIARGEIQALGAERPVKAVQSGIISLINIKEGEKVDKGELLLQFDPLIINNRVTTLTNEFLLEKERRTEQINAYNARKSSLEAKLASLKTSYELQVKIVDKLAYLESQGAIPSFQYLREKNLLQEKSSEIFQLIANLAEVNSQSSSVDRSIQREISNIERQLIEAKKISLNEQLRSPVKGRVFDLIPASPGYTAVIGETLLKIVPEGEIEAKVFITNKDIGFIGPQMKAQVRVDAYPFTQFGHIPATLKSIGEEVIPADETSPQTRFPAYLKLESQYLEKDGKRYRIKPGQSISANFIVRDKPVISLLTDAIEKGLDALRGIKS